MTSEDSEVCCSMLRVCEMHEVVRIAPRRHANTSMKAVSTWNKCRPLVAAERPAAL